MSQLTLFRVNGNGTVAAASAADFTAAGTTAHGIVGAPSLHPLPAAQGFALVLAPSAGEALSAAASSLNVAQSGRVLVAGNPGHHVLTSQLVSP